MRLRQRGGQAAVMMALSLTATFALLGFTVDVGSSYYQKQKALAAAESAALAAATYAANAGGITCNTNGVTCNGTLTSCSSITTGALYAGCQYAEQNGFAASAIQLAANTNTPPCAPCTTPSYWVQAVVSTTNHNLFLGIAGVPTAAAINAQAFAGVNSSTTGGSGSSVPADCMWVLDPSDPQSLLVSSGGVTLSSCAAQVNSTANQSGTVNGWQPTNEAANANGSSTLSGTFNVVGGASYNQNYCPSGGPFKCAAASVADPLANLRQVNEATDIGTTSCTQSSQYNPPNGTTVIPSGIYCGGINIGNSNATVSFQTGGIFEIRNGNFTISNANGTVTGTNVMFWFTNTSNSSTVHTAADPVITINTSAVNFSAPSSGTFKGILFYGDRNGKTPTTTVANGATYNAIQAGASPNLTGTFYFPVGGILYSGQATNNNGHIALIAYSIEINGQSALTWDSSGTYTGLATYGATSGTTTYTPSLIQ